MNNESLLRRYAAAKAKEQSDQPQQNRAQRRAQQRHQKSQQRRGQKHFDRQQKMAQREQIEAQRKLVREGHAFVAYWNGLPTFGVQGTAVVIDDETFPEYWARKEGLVGERIKVVAVNLDGVNYGGGTMYLDDRDGSGLHKVTEGMGSPSVPFRSVTIDESTFKAAL